MSADAVEEKDCLEMIPKDYHDSLVVDDARAILKETAP